MSGCIRVGVTEAALNPDYANVCGNRGEEVSGRFGKILEGEFFFVSKDEKDVLIVEIELIFN